MLKIPLSYRLPIGISVFLHFILLVTLSINISTQNRYRFSDQNRPMPVINALTVNQQAFNNQIKKMQRAEKQKRTAEKILKETLQQHLLALKKQRVTEQKQLLSMRDKQLQLNQQQKYEVAARKKALAMKKQKQEVLSKRQQQLQKKLLQQEIAQEKVLAATKAQQMVQLQSVLNQYKAQIIRAIEQQWIVPTDINNNLSCILLIRLASDGNVLSVETVQSSGDAVLDRSARMAVFKASPLPVPKNTGAFSEFHELRLTVRPVG
ncbi:MAG: cell envelope integrity protein TolA [Coxiella-like endosymbiont]